MLKCVAHCGVALFAASLGLAGCESPFLNRFPAEVAPVGASSASTTFVAQSSRPHELQLMLTRTDLPFKTIQCLVGDPRKNYVCSSDEQPIEVVWEVFAGPDRRLLASGTSSVSSGMASYANEWVARYVTVFAATSGTIYEVRANFVGLSAQAARTMPKVIVRIPSLNSW